MTMLRWVLILCCLATLGSGHLVGEDAISRFRDAMAGDDGYAKRDAIRALARSQFEDAEVLPLLVSAISDRQAEDFALQALRQRTGLSGKRSGNAGFPGFPVTDNHAGWQGWLGAWQQEQTEAAEREALKAEQERLQAELNQALAGETTTDPEQSAGEAAPGGDGSAPSVDDANSLLQRGEGAEERDLGKLDRIIFTNGSVLLAYITVERIDLDGTPTSVHIVHRNQAGEEDLAAGIIAHIEYDIE